MEKPCAPSTCLTRIRRFPIRCRDQAQLAYPFRENLTLSLAWQDLTGRPYTPLEDGTPPPGDAQINSVRLARYQRLDLKLHYRVTTGSTDTALFVDLINLLNRKNTVMRYAVESSRGGYNSYPYGGVRLFPIVGISVMAW